jgi:OmpA-OmpF porin, OOP family
VKKSFVLSFAAAALAASGMASAQSDWHMPWQDNFWGYIGASAGESKFRADCGSFFDCDRKDSAWKVHAGGNFSQVFGIELGYTDFGRMRAFGGDSEAQAANLTLTAGVPLGERFALFAKGGAVYGWTDVSAAPASLVRTGEKSGWGTTWGAGGTFAVNRNVQIRVDWDRYKLEFVGGDHDIDLLSAGVQLRF